MTEPTLLFRLGVAAGAAVLVWALVTGRLPGWVLWVAALWLVAALLFAAAWAAWRGQTLDRNLEEALERRTPAGDAELIADDLERRLAGELRRIVPTEIDPVRRRRDLEAIAAELEAMRRQDAEGKALPADESPGGFHHELADTCPCGPEVIYVDDDGTTLAAPLVVHHALDRRP